MITLPDSIPQGLENGRVRDLLALDPVLDSDIRQIADRLSRISRYGGAMPWPYPVSLHSVLVSRLATPRLAYEALMHDITESFGIGDLLSPVKRLCPEYREIEHRIKAQIAPWFELPVEESEGVRDADERAYQLECLFMRGRLPRPMHTRLEPTWPTDTEARICVELLDGEPHWIECSKIFRDEFCELAPQAVIGRFFR